MNPEWILAGVGILTFWAVWEQARATKDAAIASRDSIKQNERHFDLVNQQWIDLSQFSCRIVPIPDTDASATESWSFDFKISNRTPLKFSVESITCFVDGRTIPIWYRKTLGPNTHRWVRHIAVGLSAHSHEVYMNGRDILVMFAGRIVYVDAMEKHRTKLFARYARAGGLALHQGVRLRDEPPGSLDDLIAKLETETKEEQERQQDRYRSDAGLS